MKRSLLGCLGLVCLWYFGGLNVSRRDDFLRSQKVLRLGTFGDTPHVVPVWYMYSAKKFYIGTNTRTQKVKNINQNNKVALCVDTGVNSPDIYGVMGQGEARLILDMSKVRKIAIKILSRYYTTMQNESAQELLDDTDCILEIVPTRLVVWKY